MITLLAAYTPAVAQDMRIQRATLLNSPSRRPINHFAIADWASFAWSSCTPTKPIMSRLGSHFEHVWRFADKGDGYMEEVHALRDKYKADVAVLFVHDPMGCGLATRVAAEADEAFAVVHHECATSMYSLAHEIGHIIGARHDYALDSTGGAISVRPWLCLRRPMADDDELQGHLQ